jgi:hypothetical protein
MLYVFAVTLFCTAQLVHRVSNSRTDYLIVLSSGGGGGSFRVHHPCCVFMQMMVGGSVKTQLS